jgi:hypothetical protein
MPGKASNLDIDMMDETFRMHQNRRGILPERKADS